MTSKSQLSNDFGISFDIHFSNFLEGGGSTPIATVTIAAPAVTLVVTDTLTTTALYTIPGTTVSYTNTFAAVTTTFTKNGTAGNSVQFWSISKVHRLILDFQ